MEFMLRLAIIISLFLCLSGCGYTILKTESNRHVNGTREINSRPYQIDDLLGSWKGTIIHLDMGIESFRESIFSLTINRDSTWKITTKRGSFFGDWSLRQWDGSFRLKLSSSNSHEYEWNNSFAVYFKSWGVQLLGGSSGRHTESTEWNLTH